MAVAVRLMYIAECTRVQKKTRYGGANMKDVLNERISQDILNEYAFSGDNSVEMFCLQFWNGDFSKRRLLEETNLSPREQILSSNFNMDTFSEGT